ncbi:MAG TPA: hypothetical protein PKW90_24410 [Myxococcota bacterium]|nr:hypothetical protein [Myxococcota bacterium]
MSVIADTRVQRGLILCTMAQQYPLAFAPTALQSAVKPFYLDAQEYTLDLGYLEEQGLIQKSEMKVQGMAVRAIKLTAKGMDVVRKVTTDPGVEMAS